MNTEENKLIMARNIKRYMDKKGVTNQQLCDDLRFKYTTFMDWIKGVTYPRIGKVEAMANYFGCEKSDLIEDRDGQTRPLDDLIGGAASRQKKEPAPTNGNGLSMYDIKLLEWFRSLPAEKRQSLLSLGDAPEDLRGDRGRE